MHQIINFGNDDRDRHDHGHDAYDSHGIERSNLKQPTQILLMQSALKCTFS